jgi:hypothetical protein
MLNRLTKKKICDKHKSCIQLIHRKSSGCAGGPPKFDSSGNVPSRRDLREMIGDELPLLREVEERGGERRRVLKII